MPTVQSGCKKLQKKSTQPRSRDFPGAGLCFSREAKECFVNAKKIAKLAVLAALSILLVAVLRFPLVPAVHWLEYDAADIPILIGTFLYGPWTGIFLTLIVSVLQGVTVSAQSGWVGIVMHFLATSSLVLVSGCVYKFFHTKRGALVGLIAGSLTMTVLMIPLNYIFTPLYGTPVEAVTQFLPWIVLFNFAKAGINSAVTFFVYKSVGRLFREDLREETVQRGKNPAKSPRGGR